MSRVLSLVLLVTLLGACSERPQLEQHQIYVFGTLVDITLWGAEPEAAQRAVATLTQDFQRMHHDWHAWKPGPLVDLNNAIAAGEPAPVLPSLIPIIEQSRDLYRASDGLFNPAIGHLLSLWGFQADERPSGPPPAEEDIAAWVEADPGMEDVRIEEGILYSDNPTVQFDFGGFAKGYAVDLAIDRLREFGIENAIVNAGGDLRAIGSKGAEPWRVGIRHPQGGGVLGAIAVRGDRAVFTSGNYERFRAHEGVNYAHILDPRTGWPVEGVTSVTVIHDNGAVADAAATALVVAGPDEWQRIARQMGIRYVMLVDDAGTVYMNPAMQDQVDFQGQTPEHVVIGAPL